MADSSTGQSKQSPVVKFMPMILIGLVISYAALAYLLLFMPKIGKFLEGGEFDLRPLELALEDDAMYLNEIGEALEDFKAVNSAHRRKLGLMLPPDADVPGLYVQLDEITNRNGMVMSSIDALVDEAVEGPGGTKLVRLSVNIVGGDYDQFILWLNDVERLVRIADIETVSFTADAASYSILLNTYFMDEELVNIRVVDEVPMQPTDI